MTFDHCAALVIRNGLNIQIACVKCDITWNDLCILQRFVHWEWNLERNFHIRILETIYGIKPYTDCKAKQFDRSTRSGKLLAKLAPPKVEGINGGNR